MDPSSDIQWDYNNKHTQKMTVNHLLRTIAGKRWSLPKEEREDNSSIRVTAEREHCLLIATIDINIEDKPPGWKGWSNPFLHLSVSLQFDPTHKPICQKQIGTYLTYDGREVTLTEEYQAKIERYTKRKKLSLKYIEKEWTLHSLDAFRRVLTKWDSVRY